jgi:hypothetical protein
LKTAQEIIHDSQKKVTDLENEVFGLKVTVEKKEHAMKGADLTDITLRRSSKIPTLLANPCSPCIHATYDIVLHLVVSDFAAWSFLALTDYLQFLIPLSLFIRNARTIVL